MDEDEEMWFNNDEEDVDGMDNNLEGPLGYKLEAEFDQFNKKISERKSTLGKNLIDI